MTTMTKRAPWHLWLIGGLALAWNGLAGIDLVLSLVQGERYFRACGMTAEQIAYFSHFPLWVTVAWIASVGGGFLAAVALLLRRPVSALLFGLSLAGTAGNMVYGYVLADGIAAMGAMWFMPVVIAVLTGLVIVYARAVTRRR